MTVKTEFTLTDVFASTLAALTAWELPEDGLTVRHHTRGADGPEVDLAWYGKTASEVHDGLVWHATDRFARARIVHDGTLFSLTAKSDELGAE